MNPRNVRFVEDLPNCCTTTRWRAPQPDSVTHRVRGDKSNGGWDVGLDQYHLDVGAAWYSNFDDLTESLADHVNEDLTEDDLLTALADHGLDFHGETAWVGSQLFTVARFRHTLNAAAGRDPIDNGTDLWEAADAQAGDLDSLVSRIANLTDPDLMWNDEIAEQWGDEAEMVDTAILLRSVHITPVMRGYGLGAWAAASSIALFDSNRSMVATLAAPAARQDGIPGFVEAHQPLSPREQALWNTEKQRLAKHWQTTLGLVPAPSAPDVLTWCTLYTNTAIVKTLERHT